MLSRMLIRKLKGGLGDEMYSQVKGLVEEDKNDLEEARIRVISYLKRPNRRIKLGLLALRRANTFLFEGT